MPRQRAYPLTRRHSLRERPMYHRGRIFPNSNHHRGSFLKGQRHSQWRSTDRRKTPKPTCFTPQQGGIHLRERPTRHRGRISHEIGEELTSQQEGIPRREHQCIIKEGFQHQCIIEVVFRRDSAIANREPSTGARHLGDKLLPPQGGIPWATQRGIRNQRPLASYTFPCGDTNASSGLCHSQRISIGRRSPPRRRAYLSARRHPPKGTPMHHGGRRLTTKGQCHSQRITVNRRSPSWRQASPSTRRHPLGYATWH
ncbi:hypothetical protein RHGRI_038523 [Rhododendron griersonianum]|uniref:Uncharacterized protein n=1 Tax=Rhododendron griersonianum TaxID=479676 RepID=A0AAV6HN15_9ERIC|nr:hypothetical protein RHGRI_038523 [Rhododendron griersonianum]